MSKVVRRVSLASAVLLLFASGSCYIGERQYWYESQQLEKRMASGFYISHVYPETNIWQITAVLSFFAGISIAAAAFMLWRQDRKENG
jgi:hypothetical protein